MFRFAILILLIVTFPLCADELFGTDPLTEKGDLAVKMIKGIDSYLDRELKKRISEKPKKSWSRLRELLGIKEHTHVVAQRLLGGFSSPVKIADTEVYEVFAIRWSVIDGIEGEGLLIEPKLKATAQAVAIPDADQIPEDIVGLTDKLAKENQFARMLGELRIRVVVPAIVRSEGSQRNNLQRMAHSVGRNIIGYEVQQVIAAAEYLTSKSKLKIGLIGYGEGAVIAFYAGAIESAFSAITCIGYAGPTSQMEREPFVRNIWAIRKEFGLANLWTMFGERPFTIGYSDSKGFRSLEERKWAGTLTHTLVSSDLFIDDYEEQIWKSLANEVSLDWKAVNFSRPEGMKKTILFLKDDLNCPKEIQFPEKLSDLTIRKEQYSPEERQERLSKQIVHHIQDEIRAGEAIRLRKFKELRFENRKEYNASIEPLRKQFEEEFVGKLPHAIDRLNAKSRVVNETSKWTAYEVKLDMYDDIFASGIFLMPKGIKPREKRPVIVCQHGAYATPGDVCEKTKSSQYSFGSRLADLGYIVFAPLSPTVVEGTPNFEMIFRKAHPVKLTLFSFILRQHETILEWLPTIPQVDDNNIGIYGFSYGGKTALRVGAILTKYKFVICSGEFTDAIRLAIPAESSKAQVFDGKSDVFEFNSANTFSHAEMAYLIAPRPFMVERGHDDDSSRDEMVAYEYAKVKYHYTKRLGVGDRTEIEFFDGPRSANGVGTFRFIQKHTGWPFPLEID